MVALDLTADPFADVFGSRRGGGASHIVLPPPTSRESYNDALRALRDQPQMAASSAGRTLAREAVVYATANYGAEERPGGAAVKLLLASGLHSDIIRDCIRTRAEAHVRDVTRDIISLTGDPYQATVEDITDAAVDNLSSLAVATRTGTEELDHLQRVLLASDCDSLQPVIHIAQSAAGGNQPLLDRKAWARAFRQAVTRDKFPVSSTLRQALRKEFEALI